MHNKLEIILEIQKIDRSINLINSELKKIPAEIDLLFKAYNTAKDEYNLFKEKIDAEKKKRRDLESSVEEEKDHLTKIKKKLPDVKTNKEYTALIHEIENINKKIVSIEDQEITLMEKIESTEKEFPKKEAELKERENIYNANKVKLENQVEKLKSDLETKNKIKSETAASIDEDLYQTYNSLLETKNGLAIVSLDGDNCKGCFMDVPPQFAIEIRKENEIFFCPQCGRILYYDPAKE